MNGHFHISHPVYRYLRHRFSLFYIEYLNPVGENNAGNL